MATKKVQCQKKKINAHGILKDKPQGLQTTEVLAINDRKNSSSNDSKTQLQEKL
jgi:hypothetical protein